MSFAVFLNQISTPTEGSGTQRKALSPISSFLNVPPICKNAKGNKFSAAHVLTSEQCLAMIEEKEQNNVKTKLSKEEKPRERRNGF